MHDPFNDDRVRTLLREADDAARLLAQIEADGGDPREIREALVGIHRDLGRRVHDLWQKRLASPLPADAPTHDGPTELVPRDVHRRGTPVDFAYGPGPEDRSEELPSIPDETDIPEITEPPADDVPEGEDSGSWYTDEVEIEGSAPTGPLFGPGDLAGLLDDALPTVEEPAGAPGRRVAGEGDLTDLPADAVEPVRPSSFAAAVQGEPPPWLAALRELLDLLGPEAHLDGAGHAGAAAEEVARVQWATQNVDVRWGEYPEAVRVALVGLLSARARNLQERAPEDVAPRQALDRLRKYRDATGLPPVVGLLPSHAPESGAWSEDARRWWTALRAGISPGE